MCVFFFCFRIYLQVAYNFMDMRVSFAAANTIQLAVYVVIKSIIVLITIKKHQWWCATIVIIQAVGQIWCVRTLNDTNYKKVNSKPLNHLDLSNCFNTELIEDRKNPADRDGFCAKNRLKPKQIKLGLCYGYTFNCYSTKRLP